MASKQEEVPRTGIFHDGSEVAVRAKTRYSRAYHEPLVDDRGDVVFDEDGHPKPACGKVADVKWLLVPVHTVERRDPCRNCREDDDAISERNAKGADNITLARLAQRSDFDGSELLSSKETHVSGD